MIFESHCKLIVNEIKAMEVSMSSWRSTLHDFISFTKK
jgi:hypothetical protein